MKTVLVAMSGGLDSSMAAYLLKEKGYDVIGVTMAVWDEKSVFSNCMETVQKSDEKKEGSLLWKNSGCFGPSEEEDILSAQEVCNHLDIRHYVVDMREEYHRIVLTYFKDKYLQGVTPNPCIMCNQKIKFDLIPSKVRDLGVSFDMYATGHYVRIKQLDGYRYIRQGVDISKDQSYFLCRLTQNSIENTIFPLGDMLKKDVREKAQEAGFTMLAEKKESQDFIDSDDYTCLFGNKGYERGKILDMQGKEIGEHKGIIYYTIGKRRGLNISGLSEPYYVTRIDAEKNVIYAGPKSELLKKKLIAGNVIWSDARKWEGKISAKIRLHHHKAECILKQCADGIYEVDFVKCQSAITPGQTIAFYDEDTVLGGGIIETVI